MNPTPPNGALPRVYLKPPPLPQVPEVVLPYEATAFEIVKQSTDATHLRHVGTHNEIELRHKPFRINFYADGELVISGNRCVSQAHQSSSACKA